MAFVQTELRTVDGRRVAVTHFTIDAITAPHSTGEFKTELLRFVNDERPEVLVLDWSHIRHAGTDAFGVMLAVHKRLNDWGGSLRICGMNPLLSDGFTQCGLSLLIPLFADVANALEGGKEA